jgi:predicted AlkP superfamily phosphohydrolase/phosphomutase/Flp pilus assembly protein TadD
MPARLASRLLIVGWDAADWIVLDQLFAAGRMPNLRRLVDAGARCDLGTLEPKLSPLLWSSIATGKTADRHGIHNFVEPKPEGDGLRVSQSTSRRTKALWNILSQAGLRVNAVGWYASHPAEPVRGAVVSNLVQEGEPARDADPWPLVPGAVHPASLAEAVAAARVRAQAFPRETLRALCPKVDEIGASDPRVATLAKLMAHAATIEGAAHAAMSSGAWDATMVFFDAIDTVGHHFMQYRPPRMAHVSSREEKAFGEVMDRVYEWHDAALGRLLERAGPGTTVLLLSDHGFHSDAMRPNLKDLPPERRMELESSWHRAFGVLVASGPGVVRGAAFAPATILDLAPTALALLGVAVGEDMDGRVTSEVLDPALEVTRIPSWDAVEGESGEHPADLRQDPYEAADAIRQLVDLGYMAALPEDAQGQVDLVRRESRFNLAVSLMSRGRFAEAAPLFEALAAERPAEARYATCLWQSRSGLGAHAEAAAIARAFLAHDAGHLESRLMLALSLARAGDRAAAEAEYARLDREAGGRAEFGVGLAEVALRLGRTADATRHAARAKSRDPRNIGAHLALARAALAESRLEPAADHALDALEISQAVPEAHMLLAAALAWHGDLDNAKASIGFALGFDPKSPEAQRWAAVIASARGDRAGAEAHRATLAALRAEGARDEAPPANGAADFARARGFAAP